MWFYYYINADSIAMCNKSSLDSNVVLLLPVEIETDRIGHIFRFQCGSIITRSDRFSLTYLMTLDSNVVLLLRRTYPGYHAADGSLDSNVVLLLPG